MAGKHKDWSELELGPMLERQRRGTEYAHQMIERSIEQIRLSRALLKKDASKLGNLIVGRAEEARPIQHDRAGDNQHIQGH